MQQLSDLLVELGKRRLFVTCLTALTSIPVFGCCMFGLFGVLLPGMDELARRGDGNTAGVVLVALGLAAFVVMLVVPVGLVLLVTRSRARTLDAVLTPLGLHGERYLVYGRHYRGQTGGRDANVYVYRGPTFEVQLTARAATHRRGAQRGSDVRRPRARRLRGLSARRRLDASVAVGCQRRAGRPHLDDRGRRGGHLPEPRAAARRARAAPPSLTSVVRLLDHARGRQRLAVGPRGARPHGRSPARPERDGAAFPRPSGGRASASASSRATPSAASCS